MEALISAGAKGILVTPSNSTGVLNVIKKARENGILVIALDTATDPADAVDATFATDNFQAGVQQGQYARAALGSKTAKLAMLDGTPGGTVDTFRHNGFLKGFGIKEGDPAIVGQTGHQRRSRTRARPGWRTCCPRTRTSTSSTRSTSRRPRAPMPRSSAAGKTKSIVLTSIDGGCLGVQYVKAQARSGHGDAVPEEDGGEGVDAVVEYAKTGKKPGGFIDTGSLHHHRQAACRALQSKDIEFGH